MTREEVEAHIATVTGVMTRLIMDEISEPTQDEKAAVATSFCALVGGLFINIQRIADASENTMGAAIELQLSDRNRHR